MGDESVLVNDLGGSRAGKAGDCAKKRAVAGCLGGKRSLQRVHALHQRTVGRIRIKVMKRGGLIEHRMSRRPARWGRIRIAWRENRVGGAGSRRGAGVGNAVDKVAGAAC